MCFFNCFNEHVHFLILICYNSGDNASFTCNQNGYDEYLSQWSTDMKSSSRNPSSPEFSQRLEYFIDNCVKIHEWNKKDKYK